MRIVVCMCVLGLLLVSLPDSARTCIGGVDGVWGAELPLLLLLMLLLLMLPLLLLVVVVAVVVAVVLLLPLLLLLLLLLLHVVGSTA